MRVYKKRSYEEKVRYSNEANLEERKEAETIDHNLKWVNYARIAEKYLNAGLPAKAAKNYRKSADEIYAAQNRGSSINRDHALNIARNYYRKAERLEKVAEGKSGLLGFKKIKNLSSSLVIITILSLGIIFLSISLTNSVQLSPGDGTPNYKLAIGILAVVIGLLIAYFLMLRRKSNKVSKIKRK